MRSEPFTGSMMEAMDNIAEIAARSRVTQALNTSGLIPLDLRVLVKPDTVDEKVGLIIKPQSMRDAEKHAMTKGTIVAVGENAWEEASARSPAFVKPEPGSRVMIAKYGGVRITGLDGGDYVLLNDEDIIGRLEE